MEQAFYGEYAEIEDTHWWFRGRRAILARVLQRIAERPGRRILDIGVGTGAMLDFLGRYGDVVGVDMSLDAIRFARARCPRPMVSGNVIRLPVRTGAADLVTAFDVLEHVADDAAALAELARVCGPGGHVLLTVPAFGFLWGNQDIVSHHQRRYTRRDLSAKMAAAGLQPRILTYFNTLLFPVIAAVRLSRRMRGAGGGPVASDFGMTRPGPLNELLTRLFAAEAGLVAHGRLPVGVSLLALAERAASTEP